MDLGPFIRNIRKSESMSQAVLADMARKTQSKVSGVENGRANVELATLRAVCMALYAEIVIVPRKVIGSVRTVVQQHLDRDPHRVHETANRLQRSRTWKYPAPASVRSGRASLSGTFRRSSVQANMTCGRPCRVKTRSFLVR